MIVQPRRGQHPVALHSGNLQDEIALRRRDSQTLKGLPHGGHQSVNTCLIWVFPAEFLGLMKHIVDERTQACDEQTGDGDKGAN